MKHFFPQRKILGNEFLLVPETFWELFIARIMVTFFRSSKYLPVTPRNPTTLPTQEKFKEGKTIAGVINGLSVRTPWSSTCLVKVIAAHKMLEKRQIPHTLHFGLKKSTSNDLLAHTWLSVDKEIIIGGANLHQYKEISQIVI